MEIIKIGTIGIVGVFLAVGFRTIKAEYGIYIGIATGLLIFFSTLQNFALFIEEIRSFWNMLDQESEFFGVLLKVAGVAYICEFCAGICKDAGYGSVAGQIEIFGKVMVLLNGLPILLAVVRTIQNFAG